MKKINIAYWTVTILFAGFMGFTAIPDIIMEKDAVAFMNGYLGYPLYIIPFIGWAKVLGAIVLLVPGFPRLKEWAYAGMAIDLAGATFSAASTKLDMMGVAFMTVFFAFLFASYFLYHKRLKMRSAIARPAIV